MVGLGFRLAKSSENSCGLSATNNIRIYQKCREYSSLATKPNLHTTSVCKLTLQLWQAQCHHIVPIPCLRTHACKWSGNRLLTNYAIWASSDWLSFKPYFPILLPGKCTGVSTSLRFDAVCIRYSSLEAFSIGYAPLFQILRYCKPNVMGSWHLKG